LEEGVDVKPVCKSVNQTHNQAAEAGAHRIEEAATEDDAKASGTKEVPK
jgi:hypothetical protein